MNFYEEFSMSKFANKYHRQEAIAADWERIQAENETLRARLAELEKQELVGYLIDWPEEPELGFYFSEERNDNARSRPLFAAPVVSPLSSTSETDVEKLKAENQSLKTELEAARSSRAKDALDAERYRWMRSFRPGLWLDGITLEPIENKGYALQLDSAIDAAIEQASSCNELHEKGGA